MLLFPRPFGSRLGVRLGVFYPERRSPPVTILSVRTTAHVFQDIRLSSEVNLGSGSIVPTTGMVLQMTVRA